MANYKTSWMQRLIEGVWQKTFAFAHAKTVYTDYANKKTLADKLSEIDTEIGNKANKTEIPTECGYVGSVLDGVYTDLAVLTPTKEAAERGTKEYSISYEFKGLDMSGISDQCFLALKAGGNVLKLCVAKLLSDGTMAQVSTAAMSSIAAQYRVISEDGTVGEWRNFGGELTLELHLQNYTLAAGLPLLVKGAKLIVLPANGGNSATVNGHTVKSDVPENAVFTDTVYDDTEVQKRISDNSYGEIAGGKNLVTVSSFSTPNNEIIFTKKDDSTLIANGSNYNTGLVLSNGFLAKAGIIYTAQIITDLQIDMFMWNIDEKNSVPVIKNDNKKIYFSVTKDTNIAIAINADNMVFNNTEIKVQIEEGSVATEYEPYFPSNKMLAEENYQQSTEIMDIKMLGWSVPKECPVQNEVNGNQFIQKVGRVDLSSLSYTYEPENVQFYSGILSSLPQEEKWNFNLYCNKYPTGSRFGDSFIDSYIASYGGRIYLRDKNYTNVSTLVAGLKNTYLYYELATPITTTIDGNEIGETVSDVRKETTVNLLKPTLQTTTLNGVICTNNGDGTYTLNGTNNSGDAVVFWCGNIQKFKAGTYKLLGTPNNTTASIGGSIYGHVEYEGATVSSDSEISGDIAIVIPNGISCDNLTFKPMLTTNLNATYDDFVPYTGDSGSLNGDVAEKAPKKNPVFTGSVTVGSRLSDTDFGQNSFTNGDTAQARGNNSFATGDHPVSLGANSQSLGCYTFAKANQCAIGHFNSSSSDDSAMYGTTGTAFYIGNGDERTRSNAFRVAYDGTPYSKAGLNTTGADYAEFFEWEDGNVNNEDRRGYFVTLDGKHIKIAKEGDWILGIVSGFPAIIGNGDEEWRGRYVFDDFGCPVIEEFEYAEKIPEVIINDEGEEEVITKKVKKTGTKWKEVPEYDPERPYVQRSERKEWSAVGMLGVLSVRDDGSCKVNGFCKLANGGIATDSDTGYRVVKRVADNIVEIIFK